MRGVVAVVSAICVLGPGCETACARVAALPRWSTFRHLAGPVDVVGPRRDGRMVIATHAGLALLNRSGAVRPFARGPSGYAPDGGETYIALTQPRRLVRSRCSFRRDDVYALQIMPEPAVTRVDARGVPHRFGRLPGGVFPSGIAFDTVGSFGHRLLVISLTGQSASLFAFDCRGRSVTLGQALPPVEGGIAVGPKSFGRFGGDLVGADERSGRVLAVSPGGRARVIADSGLPAGGDIGVESIGFAPPGLGRHVRAFLADPGGQPGANPGSDSVLSLSGRALAHAGVRADDLLVAREGGGETIRIRCRNRCSVRRVATGPAVTHAEGHIAFGRIESRRSSGPSTRLRSHPIGRLLQPMTPASVGLLLPLDRGSPTPRRGAAMARWGSGYPSSSTSATAVCGDRVGG